MDDDIPAVELRKVGPRRRRKSHLVLLERAGPWTRVVLLLALFVLGLGAYDAARQQPQPQAAPPSSAQASASIPARAAAAGGAAAAP
ncbi:MAG: hypothetical protein KGO96_10025, partial [Elusimicrobia bacterium]|nr:hypothetical protein [Elusimicrobiota bacterium]